MPKINESFQEEIKQMPTKDAFELYSKLADTIKAIEANKVKIDPEDLKPKRMKRGSKNRK